MIVPPYVLSEMHTHDYYELFLIVSGSVHHEINGTTSVLSADTLYWIRPEDVHCYRHPSKDFQLLNITIRRAIAEALLGYIDSPLETSCRLSPAKTAPVLDYWKHNLVIHKDTLAQLVLMLRKSAQEAFVPDWLVSIATALRDPHWFADGVNSISALTDKSLSHVSREFRRYYGQTIISYITEQRLLYAARLLCKTSMSVLDVSMSCGFDSVSHARYRRILLDQVSMSCGFDSVSHLNHIFKKRFQMTPKEYRKTYFSYV